MWYPEGPTIRGADWVASHRRIDWERRYPGFGVLDRFGSFGLVRPNPFVGTRSFP